MMKPNKALKLLAAGVVFLVGAVLPLRSGDSVNTTLLLLAGGFIVLAVKFARKAPSSIDSKSPAA